VEFAQRPSQQFVCRPIEVHDLSGLVELLLRNGERISF
jgi:hypothetical protein